jgi:hypothetical protein
MNERQSIRLAFFYLTNRHYFEQLTYLLHGELNSIIMVVFTVDTMCGNPQRFLVEIQIYVLDIFRYAY